MGVFDVFNKVNTTIQGAVNEYKEKQEKKEAEKRLMESIYDEISDYVESQLETISADTAEKILSLEILCYNSFKKENFADGYDVLYAQAYVRSKDAQENLLECFEEYANREHAISAIDEFYKRFFEDALETDWYCSHMQPFYEEDALNELVCYLHQILQNFLCDVSLFVCSERYKIKARDMVYELLEDKGFDFWNPLVAFMLNSGDDDDLEKNLNRYEKQCFKRYKEMTIFYLLKKYGLKKENKKIPHVHLYNEGEACFAEVVNDMFCYLPVAYKNVTKIDQLSIIANDKPIMIPFSELLYWRQEGECRKEVGIREPNAVVALYAATKGVVAPQRLEEREVDTRCIVLVTKKTQVKFSYSSNQVFEDLLPQYQYERVLFHKEKGLQV